MSQLLEGDGPPTLSHPLGPCGTSSAPPGGLLEIGPYSRRPRVVIQPDTWVTRGKGALRTLVPIKDGCTMGDLQKLRLQGITFGRFQSTPPGLHKKTWSERQAPYSPPANVGNPPKIWVRAFPSLQTLPTVVQSWLRAAAAMPVENFARQDCWQRTHELLSQCTRQRCNPDDPSSLRYNVPPEGVPTDADHVFASVCSDPRTYPRGLLMLHTGAQMCIWFVPGCGRRIIFLEAGLRLVQEFPDLRIALYIPSRNVMGDGHFVGCLRTADTCEATCFSAGHVACKLSELHISGRGVSDESLSPTRDADLFDWGDEPAVFSPDVTAPSSPTDSVLEAAEAESIAVFQESFGNARVNDPASNVRGISQRSFGPSALLGVDLVLHEQEILENDQAFFSNGRPWAEASPPASPSDSVLEAAEAEIIASYQESLVTGGVNAPASSNCCICQPSLGPSADYIDDLVRQEQEILQLREGESPPPSPTDRLYEAAEAEASVWRNENRVARAPTPTRSRGRPFSAGEPCGRSSGQGGDGHRRNFSTDRNVNREQVSYLADVLGIEKRFAVRGLREHPRHLDMAAAEAIRLQDSPSAASSRPCRARRLSVPPTGRADLLRSGQLSEGAWWRRQGPPTVPFSSDTDSWFIVPLLLDAACLLEPQVAAEWETHICSTESWSHLRTQLRSRPLVPGCRWLDGLRLAIDGAMRAGRGDVAMHASASADRLQASIAGLPANLSMTYRDLVTHLVDEDGYLSALTQEFLLATCIDEVSLAAAKFRQAGLVVHSSVSLAHGRPSALIHTNVALTQMAAENIAPCSAHVHSAATASVPAGRPPVSTSTNSALLMSVGTYAPTPTPQCESTLACASNGLQPCVEPEHVHMREQSNPSAIHSASAAVSFSGPAFVSARQSLRAYSGEAPPQRVSATAVPSGSMPDGACAPSADPPVQQFWRARQAALDEAVRQLYERHRAGFVSDDAALDAFMELPVDWPVSPQHFGLTLADVCQAENDLFIRRVEGSSTSTRTIDDARATPLEVLRLCPFFVAVVLQFASEAGIAPEFPFGLLYTLTCWVCHPYLHAVFDSTKPEWETRPRILSCLIGGANCGKTPFSRQCLQPVFYGTPGVEPLLQQFASLFADGGKKGLLLAQATQADFGDRMCDTKGHNVWATDEGLGVVDTVHAMGGGRFNPKRDPEKINFHYILGTQNGFSYGPTSVKSNKEKQYYVNTTQFGFFHCAQPKAVHEYWGHTMRASSPISGQGGRHWFTT